MSAPIHPEAVNALRDAARWLGKAIADGAFDKCVNPKAAERCLEVCQSLVNRADREAA